MDGRSGMLREYWSLESPAGKKFASRGLLAMASLGLYLEHRRERMTLPASHVRLGDIQRTFLAVGADLNLLAEKIQHRTRDARTEADELTGVGALNARHGTGLAQRRIPFESGDLKKAALLAVSSAGVIAVEVGTFSAVGSFHSLKVMR